MRIKQLAPAELKQIKSFIFANNPGPPELIDVLEGLFVWRKKAVLNKKLFGGPSCDVLIIK